MVIGNKINGKTKKMKIINWNEISQYQELSEKFIEKHQDKVNRENISWKQKLIEKYQDKVMWKNISAHQKLSEEFIEKF